MCDVPDSVYPKSTAQCPFRLSSSDPKGQCVQMPRLPQAVYTKDIPPGTCEGLALVLYS